MIKPFLICIILLLQTVSMYASDKLLLYHVSKQVHWIHDGKKEDAKRGIFLLPQHSLIITSHSNVMLVQQDGKSMLLDKPGNYSYSHIKTLLQKLKAASVSKNFFAYVFEQFLSGEGDEKQKVAAVVYRGKKEMLLPHDSSFAFTVPVLFWKPQYPAIPYKIEIVINQKSFDTVIHKQTLLTIDQYLLSNQPQLIKWFCYPKDSKQKPPPFIFLIPKQKDASIIKQQLTALKRSYGANPSLLRQMNKDLLRQWITTYQLQ